MRLPDLKTYLGFKQRAHVFEALQGTGINPSAKKTIKTTAVLRALASRCEVFLLHKPYTTPPSGGPGAKIDPETTEAVRRQWAAVLGAERILTFSDPKASVVDG